MQFIDPPLQRLNLSEAVIERLRAMIVDGQLAAGERINEVQLSERLGVSRTPLREALARLAAEGALNSVPRIGYFVCALTIEEFEQIYPIRAILDPAALQLMGLPSAKTIERLKALNAKLEAEKNPVRAIDLDDKWHRELLHECPNTVLLALIDQFILRTRRYEMALMRERSGVVKAVADHRAILKALVAGDLNAAYEALRANMTNGREPIARWLRSRVKS